MLCCVTNRLYKQRLDNLALLQRARTFYYAGAENLPVRAETGRSSRSVSVPRYSRTSHRTAGVGKHIFREVYDAPGGSSVYETCPLEQHFRDPHTAAQHVQVSPNNFEFAGCFIPGLDPGTVRVSGPHSA